MAYMEIYTTPKGALYAADCNRCGCTLTTHEWADSDHNERRDAMEAGTLRCGECSSGAADPDTFHKVSGRAYAGRYSASGYMDCTPWSHSNNLRVLIRELREMYGD